jgi:hypothetical protein
MVEVDSESENVITNKEQNREKDDEKKSTVFYLNNTATKKEYHWWLDGQCMVQRGTDYKEHGGTKGVEKKKKKRDGLFEKFYYMCIERKKKNKENDCQTRKTIHYLSYNNLVSFKKKHNYLSSIKSKTNPEVEKVVKG